MYSYSSPLQTTLACMAATAEASDWRRFDCEPLGGLRLLALVEGTIPKEFSPFLVSRLKDQQNEAYELVVNQHPTAKDFTADLRVTAKYYCKNAIKIELDIKNVPPHLQGHRLHVMVNLKRPKTNLSAELNYKFTRRLDSSLTGNASVYIFEDVFYASNSIAFLVQVFEVQRAPAVPPLMQKLQRVRLGADLEGVPPCDLRLSVNDHWWPAHRFVLSASSEVFAKMLMGNFKEAREGHIVMTDVSPVVVEMMLDHLYTGSIDDWANLELELLGIAHRYHLQQLEADCRLQLWMVDSERALSLLEDSMSDPLIDSNLRRRWMRLIVDCGLNRGQSPEWTAFQEKFPAMVDAIDECSAFVKVQNKSVSSVPFGALVPTPFSFRLD